MSFYVSLSCAKVNRIQKSSKSSFMHFCHCLGISCIMLAILHRLQLAPVLNELLTFQLLSILVDFYSGLIRENILELKEQVWMDLRGR